MGALAPPPPPLGCTPDRAIGSVVYPVGITTRPWVGQKAPEISQVFLAKESQSLLELPHTSSYLVWHGLRSMSTHATRGIKHCHFVFHWGGGSPPGN